MVSKEKNVADKTDRNNQFLFIYRKTNKLQTFEYVNERIVTKQFNKKMNRFSDIEISDKRLPPIYGYRSAKLVSLEIALEPLVAEIDELPYYIKLAKKHCHYPSEHGLSKDESAAIYIYTMEWGDTSLYRILNKALRSENRQALKIWFPYLKLFNLALDKLPTIKDVVWRGVPLDLGKHFVKNQNKVWWSINSCTLSVDIIKRFLGQNNNDNYTLFLIETIKGKKVSGYTEYEGVTSFLLSFFITNAFPFESRYHKKNRAQETHIYHYVIESSLKKTFFMAEGISSAITLPPPAKNTMLI